MFLCDLVCGLPRAIFREPASLVLLRVRRTFSGDAASAITRIGGCNNESPARRSEALGSTKRESRARGPVRKLQLLKSIGASVRARRRRSFPARVSSKRPNPRPPQLDISRRSLQRSLGCAGTSFDALLRRALIRRASELLRAGVGATQTAFELGYADAAHFSRAFRRWTGQTPRDVAIERQTAPARQQRARMRLAGSRRTISTVVKARQRDCPLAARPSSTSSLRHFLTMGEFFRNDRRTRMVFSRCIRERDQRARQGRLLRIVDLFAEPDFGGEFIGVMNVESSDKASWSNPRRSLALSQARPRSLAWFFPR